MRNLFYITVVTTILFSCNSKPKFVAAEYPNVYNQTWESMKKANKEPDWFADAKLGIYFHWGPYSVPAYGSEWYPRWMYFENHAIGKHHKETWGDPTEFNYHDFIPMFKAEYFDAAEWADVFKNAGAKFAGPVAQHHDGFAMWNSKVNPWNAMDKGPHKDILGELFAELKKRDLRTIATFHHARTLQRYTNDTANWGGNMSHYPYNPAFATSTTDPELKYLYGTISEEEFNQYWLDEVREVIDNYAPDIIWFDSWLDRLPESYRQKMVQHQLNAGDYRNQETLVCYKQQDLPRSVGVLDIEQGGMKEMSPDYWMTDITLSTHSWSYIENQKYKQTPMLIRNMIDVWSKKGIVLLNISPKANGTIPNEQRKVLSELGEWLQTYGEAVYNTRTHSIFGYGDAKIEKGHFGGQSASINYSASDVRFTKAKDGKALYVFFLGLPDENTSIEIKHVLNDTLNTIKSVSLLGSASKIAWEITDGNVKITTPASSEMNEIATIFKIDL